MTPVLGACRNCANRTNPFRIEKAILKLPLISYGLYGLYNFSKGVWNGLYTVCMVCTGFSTFPNSYIHTRGTSGHENVEKPIQTVQTVPQTIVKNAQTVKTSGIQRVILKLPLISYMLYGLCSYYNGL